mgnify:CR=1 FL=1
MKVKNITCIGAGYVGGPTMAVIALKCPEINVTVVDIDNDKINAWNGPIENLPVYEPGLSDIIKVTRNKNLFFSIDVEQSINESDMIFMAVNTPTKETGEGAGMASDLKYVIKSSKMIAKYSQSDKIIIEKSTLPVRTAEKIKKIVNKNSRGIKFEILSNPEFLAEGTAIQDLFKSDRVLIGSDQTESGIKAADKLSEIYERWIPKEKILKSNIWSSELSKLASNAMLAQRISSINSLSALCSKTGADIDEVSKAIGMDHRIGAHFLKVSPGFGGSCFKKDILNLVYLCQFYGLDDVAEYWHGVVKINDHQQKRITEIIQNYFIKYSLEKKISILGWAFKKNTNDSRESASIYITYQLLKLGFKVNIYDPMVSRKKILKDINAIDQKRGELHENYLSNIEVYETLESIVSTCKIITILTEWDEFLSIEKISSDYEIFDFRNILSKNSVKLRL